MPGETFSHTSSPDAADAFLVWLGFKDLGRLQFKLVQSCVHIIIQSQTESLTSPLRGALTVVGVDSIHTGSSISTLMARAVINVVLTVSTIET